MRFTSFVNEMKSMEYAVADTREFLDLPELSDPAERRCRSTRRSR